MDLRSALDKIKSVFTVGEGNRWLLGDKQGRQSNDTSEDMGAYQQPYQQEQSYAQPYQQEQSYAQPYPQAGYAQPYGGQAYAPPQGGPQAGYQAPNANYYQPNYAPRQPQGAVPSNGRLPQQNGQPYNQNETMGFQSQFSPEGAGQAQRNRRAQQHQVEKPLENVVPFPGVMPNAASEPLPMDAYVINVFNIQACRQAMACLRKGQCTLIVMDQLTDRNETRRFVDMLTGACYALGGTMTRLSTKIGFYLMAPQSMTVYTDAVTSGANNPRQQVQTPPLRAQSDFTPQSTPEIEAMNFNQQQPQRMPRQPAPLQQQQNAAWQPQQAGYQPPVNEWRQPMYEQPVADMQEYYADEQLRYAAQ